MPFPTPRPRSTSAGMHVATVTRTDVAGAYVEVPSLGTGYEYGPARFNPTDPVDTGDTVVVGFLDNALDDVVVLTRLGPPRPAPEPPPAAPAAPGDQPPTV